jgi:hypothetical protein
MLAKIKAITRRAKAGMASTIVTTNTARLTQSNDGAESFGYSELTVNTPVADTYQAVRATGRQTAKITGLYPSKGGNTAHTQGGFFSPVECAHGGFMPGMRGLQHGENRNKRVVPFWTIEIPGNFCQPLKPKEYETMNATISMGAPAHNPLQALARLLSAKPSYTRTTQTAPGLQLIMGMDGNITVTSNSKPVAWILPGYHRSQVTGLRCEFVDVAYRRKTRNGINMETADFATLQESVDFITDIFGGAA